jgi:ferritin
MKTNRLSDSLTSALNDQLTKEAHAAQIYLSYAAWAESEGFGGVANFLFRHSHEERNHMMKIVSYILERGAKVKISAIPAPPSDPANLESCFEKVFEHEVDNTKSIYRLFKQSMNEEDWATWNFMQWFVKEQTEEETLALKLLDKIKVAGNDKGALYELNRELEKTPDDVSLAEESTTDNPV